MCLQVREFKEAFGFFNAQNPRENELSAGEVLDAMTRFEPHKDLDIKEIEALIREVDTDDTGTIDFPKFLKIMGRTSVATESLTDQEDVMFAASSSSVTSGTERRATRASPSTSWRRSWT